MIKNNIKKLRRSMDLSQRALAEIMGVNQNLISAWELGKSASNHDPHILDSSFWC